MLQYYNKFVINKTDTFANWNIHNHLVISWYR